jgi:iron complex outermembrane receptor protein
MQRLFKMSSLTLALGCISVTHAALEGMPDHPTPDVSLTPLVVTAVSGNQANGLIIETDPKQAIQPIPASDGAAYLKSIMGFNAISSGGSNSDVTFRGMFGSRIKMLSDGSENLGACPARMDSPTAYIAPENFDRISVIKGPQTVQYATPGSAATVIFQRKRPQFEPHKFYQGQASVVMGSFGRLDHNIESLLGNEHYYLRLNANRSTANDYQDGHHQSIHSHWQRWNTDLALGWTPDADTWLEFKAGTGDGQAAYAGRSMDGAQFKRQTLGLRLEKTHLSPYISKLEAQIDYQNNDHIMDNYSLRTPPVTQMHGHSMANPMSMLVSRQTLNSRIALTSDWQPWQLITGLDSQYNKHAGDMKMYAMPAMNTPYHDDAKFQSYGGFAELSYTFNPRNKVVSGARLDHVTTDDLDNQQSRSEQLLSSFIRLENQSLTQQFKNYIGLGYVERMPDYWELLAVSNSSSIFQSLAPEKTLQLDLGTQWKHEAWSSWISAYAGLIDDYILLTYSSASVKNSSNIDAAIAGAEAGIGYQFNPQFQADLSTMYAWGENRHDHSALPQIAPLEARLNLRYTQQDLSLGLLWRMVAKQNRVSLNQGNVVGYDLKNSAGFGLLSLNAAYQITKALNLSFGVDNLFNKAYTEHLNKLGNAGAGLIATEQFNNLGRNYWARINFKF